MSTSYPSTDPASLDRLHDIIAPPPVSWWPPAVGWYVLLAGLSLLLVIAFATWLVRYVQDRYRREALAVLHRIGTAPASGEAIADIDILLKRVALTAFPRVSVASLTGDAWILFLRSADAGWPLTSNAEHALRSAPYAHDAVPSDSIFAEVLSAARHWICHHRFDPAKGDAPC